MAAWGGVSLTNRRQFLSVLGGAAAVLTSCGRGDIALGPAGTTGSDATTPEPAPAGIAEPATVTRHAVRGEAFQALEPAPPPRTWRPGQFVTHVDVSRRLMALTFDDGPSPYNTESVLRTLDSFGIKATFFLVGVNVRSWPDIARRTYEAGHQLGNHSVYHTPYSSSSLASQIGPNQDIIQWATGNRPIVNRAPGLAKGSAILGACAAHDLFECHTHMATYDWESPRHSAGALYREFVRDHRNGAFALYHDGGGRRPTPAALPDIIRYGLSVGYQFVTAEQLMLSGVPQPVTSTNQYTQSVDEPDGPSSGFADDTEPFVDVCNYDAEAELLTALEDLSLSYAERMRVVEVLADIEQRRAED